MRRKSDHELIQENGGKYALVMGVTRRAKQLADGARSLIDISSLNYVHIAMEEVAQGRLRIVPPEMPTRRSPLRSWPTQRGDDGDA